MCIRDRRIGLDRCRHRVQHGLGGHGCIDPQGQVAHHHRLARQLAHLRQFAFGQGIDVQLEHHRRVRQVGLLRPARVQFTDPANLLAIQRDAGAAARMQRGMGRGFEAQAGATGAEQRLDVHLHVVEIDLSLIHI